MATFYNLARPWLEQGWTSPLPLPYRQKFAPPKGYTGPDGLVPTDADIEAWSTSKPSNMALHLPHNVMGLDVDAYDTKHGAKTLRELEAKLGKLPKTYRITSRNDGVSGIYLFRNVSHNLLKGVAGPGIEIVQKAHRYVVAPGSVHPEGRVYGILFGNDSVTGAPSVRDLPRLPRKWVAYLTAEQKTAEEKKKTVQRSVPSGKVRMSEKVKTDPCPFVLNALSLTGAKMMSGESRFESVLSATYNLHKLCEEGHSGTAQAVAMLEEVYVSSVLGTRSEREARAEFKRMTMKLRYKDEGHCVHSI